MGTYVDFIEMIPSNSALVREFKTLIEKCSVDELSRWFNSIGYNVSNAECDTLLKNGKANYIAKAVALPY